MMKPSALRLMQDPGAAPTLHRAAPPRFIFIQTNQRCNLRCNHCDFWKLDDDQRDKYVQWPRKNEILEEFAQIGGQVVVTCGGEPMLDIDDYFQLAAKARDLNLKMFSVINGTRVHTPARAMEMVIVGPHEITVSLDSHIEAEHDRIRGVKGSFKVAVKALRLMLAARKESGSPAKIYAMTIVTEHNYRELDNFYDFVLNDVGADKLKLNIIQPTFGIAGGAPDQFYAGEQVHDPADLARVVSACDAKYKLNVNPGWLHQVQMYFSSVAAGGHSLKGWASPTGTAEHICNTYDRNIMVDLWGNAQLCFSHEFPGMKLEKMGDLRRFWHEYSLPIRDQMAHCNRYCGISHSVRREHATLKNLPQYRDETLHVA